MKIRRFLAADIDEVVALFYNTVHTINRRDYTKEQLDAWAPEVERAAKRESWLISLQQNLAYVAEKDGVIIGFSDMTAEGHLDRMYVHRNYQGQGIASILLNGLEEEAGKLGLTRMDTDASITAKPFFERHGFIVIQLQTVERGGVPLNNFRMEKLLRGVNAKADG